MHLTQTEKGGRERKSRLMDRIRAAIDEYDRVIVFSFDNMRSTPFKAMRETMAGHSRFFLGSNKVMQIALGRDAASAYRGGLNRVAAVLTGQVGLMCTNKTVEEVEREFEEHGELRFDPAARSPKHTLIEEAEGVWRVRQVLVDPGEHLDWSIAADIDLARAREEGRPVLELRSVGPS